MYYTFDFWLQAKAFIREHADDGARLVASETRMNMPQWYRVFIPRSQ
jgi:hypothetical protein